MRAFKSEFDRRNVAIVVISFAEPGRLVPYKEVYQLPFTILADPERKLYQALGLRRLRWYRVFSLATLRDYLKQYRRALPQLEPDRDDDIYQGGGNFVIDRGGNVIFAHRSEDPVDRPTMGALLKAIDGNPNRL